MATLENISVPVKVTEVFLVFIFLHSLLFRQVNIISVRGQIMENGTLILKLQTIMYKMELPENLKIHIIQLNDMDGHSMNSVHR
jgi:hypothetical protein